MAGSNLYVTVLQPIRFSQHLLRAAGGCDTRTEATRRDGQRGRTIGGGVEGQIGNLPGPYNPFRPNPQHRHRYPQTSFAHAHTPCPIRVCLSVLQAQSSTPGPRATVIYGGGIGFNFLSPARSCYLGNDNLCEFRRLSPRPSPADSLPSGHWILLWNLVLRHGRILWGILAIYALRPLKPGGAPDVKLISCSV